MKQFLFGLVLIFLALIFAFPGQIKDHDQSVHYHAGFTVYINGVKQDFSDFKYMNFTACSEHDRQLSPEQEQLEKAHLHDGDGDVVHVHREGAVWGDLFRNINFTFPRGLDVVGYQDSSSDPDILSRPITADSSVIIVAGDSAGIDLNDFVTMDRIREVEAKSELCGT